MLFFGLTVVFALLFARLVSPLVASTGSYQPGLLTKYAGLFVIATFAIELVLAGGTAIAQTNEIRIGLMYPTSGPAAKSGQETLEELSKYYKRDPKELDALADRMGM